jgi:hypothetical protein
MLPTVPPKSSLTRVGMFAVVTKLSISLEKASTVAMAPGAK